MLCSFGGALVILINNFLWILHVIPNWVAIPVEAIVLIVMAYTGYCIYKDGSKQVEESKRRYDRLRELERQFKADYGVDLDLTTGLKRS